MKKDARSLPTKAQEALRTRAVKAVVKGMKQQAAAQTFGVTRQAVGKWMKAYREGGMKALVAKAQGRPKTGGRLEGWQAATIVNQIKERDPEHRCACFADHRGALLGEMGFHAAKAGAPRL